jgi:hypothetical protein
VLAVSKLETLLWGDIDILSTYKLEVLAIISLVNGRVYNQYYSGGWLQSRVCIGISAGVDISIIGYIVACQH